MRHMGCAWQSCDQSKDAVQEESSKAWTGPSRKDTKETRGVNRSQPRNAVITANWRWGGRTRLREPSDPLCGASNESRLRLAICLLITMICTVT